MKSRSTTQAPGKTKKTDLRTAAAKFEAALEWEKAAGFYSQALEAKLPPAEQVDLLGRRAGCFRRLGNYHAEATDLDAMLHLAQQAGDLPRQVNTLNYLEDSFFRQGHLEEAGRVAKKAVSLARRTGDPKLEADSLSALCEATGRQNQFAEAEKLADQALRIYRSLNDLAGEARISWLAGIFYKVQGNLEAARIQAERALTLYRQVGDLEGQGNALNVLGQCMLDQAQTRVYFEQALAAFTAAGDRPGCAMLGNNLGSIYIYMGLYERARQLTEPAVEFARQAQATYALGYYLGNLAAARFFLGEAEEAIRMKKETIQLNDQVGNKPNIASNTLELGMAFVMLGKPVEAMGYIRKALKIYKEMELPDQMTALAWLGAAQLALGKFEAALQTTRRAVRLLGKNAAISSEYPMQEIWWWRYQALTEGFRKSPSKAQAEEAWQAIDQAREALLSGIASLSDDGLRRNYFNKVAINRQIIQAWLEQASLRKLPLEPLTDALSGAGNVQEPFKRLIEIGVRLNALRDPDKLPASIMNEVVELTGAERAALFVFDGDQPKGQASPTALNLPDGESETAFLKKIQPILKVVARSGQPVLRYLPEKAPPLKQHSILCVPLITAGKQVGTIYTELGGFFGRFTTQDLDLLKVLANQSAVAIENAAWARTLEDKVEQRTAELQAARSAAEQRAAELQIINSIQQGLASQLDFQAIIELVGNKLLEIFTADVVGIILYDQKNNLVSYPFILDHGQRYFPAPLPPSGIIQRMMQSRAPIIVQTNEELERLMEETKTENKGGPTPDSSHIIVPILAGEQFIGAISIAKLPAYAFNETDVRLLQTLASSMSVALENARLFDETQRLLKETEQRAAELAVINTVQAALAAELDIQAIYALVGEKLREIFDAQTDLD